MKVQWHETCTSSWGSFPSVFEFSKDCPNSLMKETVFKFEHQDSFQPINAISYFKYSGFVPLPFSLLHGKMKLDY
jgi:hypothetical protein